MCKAVFCALTFVVLAARGYSQTVTGNSVVLSKQYQDALLTCVTTDKQSSCTWSFYGAVLKTSDYYTVGMSADGTNCTLIVKLASAKNFGTYNCSIVFADGGTPPAMGNALLEAAASVESFGQSVSVTEGDRAQLTCKAVGLPQPRVSWSKQDVDTKAITTIDHSNIRCSFAAVGSIANAILYIDNVQVSDRATYICNATNNHGSGSNSVLLRVKSKMAPLWPAIGIIIELVVLACIIIIYEVYKKKSAEKGDDEKDLTTNSHDTKTKSS